MRVDWQDSAVCTPEDARAFTAHIKPKAEEILRLTTICSTCTVTRECALLALDIDSAGVYAGIYYPACGVGRPAARRELIRKANQ